MESNQSQPNAGIVSQGIAINSITPHDIHMSDTKLRTATRIFAVSIALFAVAGAYLISLQS